MPRGKMYLPSRDLYVTFLALLIGGTSSLGVLGRVILYFSVSGRDNVEKCRGTRSSVSLLKRSFLICSKHLPVSERTQKEAMALKVYPAIRLRCIATL